MISDDPKVLDISQRLLEKMSENEKLHVYGRVKPKMGLHHELDFWTYLLWDAFGSGDVRKVGHSPAHLRQSWLKGDDANPSMLTGRAIHACVLEPDTEWLRYQRLPDGKDRRSKDYKEMAEEYGKDFVLRDNEYDACIGCRDRLLGHTRIGRLLAKGSPEVTFAWHDPETGLPLKGRADWLSPELKTVFDLKTTSDARETQFTRVVRDKDYPTQGAHYLNGLRECGVEIDHYVIVAIESSPPYEPVLYRVSSKDMMIADAHWRALVDLLGWCVENDKWPGYPEHTHVLHMGPWWETDVQTEIATMRERMG